MNGPIDFSKGGYQGDVVEETYKRFTATNMPFWWHFREVLKVNQEVSASWKKLDDSALSDDEQRELIALSLLNYAVYTGIAESIASFEQMKCSLAQNMPHAWRVFEVRRPWKAMYSSLYSALNALSNITCVVVGQKSAFGERPGIVWNFTPKNALDLVNGKGLNKIAEPLDRCRKRLEIRDHLDHYWVIWVAMEQGKFMMDGDFEKGRVPLRPGTEIKFTIDAQRLAHDHLVESAKDFNLVYQELAMAGGFLDQYLNAKGWKVDYSTYGPPHNGQRPRP
jgi:hypothetical protein